MNRSISILLRLASSFFVVYGFLPLAPVRAQSLAVELSEPADQESEIMTRGPLHEAFAEQVNYDAQPGITIRKPPPEPVEEIPPDVRPEGANIEWIPGYWAWDDELEDFLWVSGVWRDVPPDRQWMPGYWAEVEGGYQWIAGFWNLVDANEVEYLPYPPDSLERGPTSPQPSVSHFWISGCWKYQDQRYLWRPGFWHGYREDWIWTPAHYVWTPRGAIYIRGYWDYPLARRGLLFAPVYFPSYASYQHRYRYSPSIVIDLSHVLHHLFVQPRHHHYYWGDYYGDRYRRAGYQANFAFHGRGGYDPLFNYYNTQSRRHGIDYSARLRDSHRSQELHQDRRPPRTWHQQQALAVRVGNGLPSSRELLAQPLRDVIKEGHAGVKFRQVDSNVRQSLGHRSRDLRELAQHRHSTEAKSLASGRAGGELKEQLELGKTPTKLPLPKVGGREPGIGGRVNVERPVSRPDGPNGTPASRSTPRTTPDRISSSPRSDRNSPLKRSELLPRADDRIDGNRGKQQSPPVVAGPQPAAKRPTSSKLGLKQPERNQPPPKLETRRGDAPQPKRASQIGPRRTPERSTGVPSLQPKLRLELPKAALDQRVLRQREAPATQLSPKPSVNPSASARRPGDSASRLQSAPRLQAKPEIGRQSAGQLLQNRGAASPFVPRVQTARPAAKMQPGSQPPRSQARSDASRVGRANSPNVRSSNNAQRSAPPRQEKATTGGGRGKGR